MQYHKPPLYFTIYSEILNDIKTGVLMPGDRVLSEKELSAKYEVSRITSKRALELLSDKGYITRTPGRGSFVKDVNVEENLGSDNSKQLMIGVVIEEFAENFGTFIISGIERACSESGYAMILKRSFGSQAKEKQAIDELLKLGVSGLIIMPVHGDNYNDAILKLSIEKFPTILVDRELKGISLSYIGTDNFACAKTLTDYLFDMGHKNICFAGPSAPDTSTVLDRLNGFIKSNAEHNVLTVDNSFVTTLQSTLPRISSNGNIAEDVDIISAYLQSNPHVTAVFAVEYNIALTVMKAAETIGKRVPEDIEIVCFDGPTNYIGRYEFTHIRQNEEAIGGESVRYLLKMISEDATTNNIIIKGRLCKRKGL